MRLIDNPQVKATFSASLKEPVNLNHLIKKVRRGITEQHPALGVAICASLVDQQVSKVFFKDNHSTAIVRRTIHHMYLLEELVSKSSSNLAFMKSMQTYLYAQVDAMLGTTSTLLKYIETFRAGGIFGVVKKYCVDRGVQSLINQRENTAAITEADVKGWADGLSINIIEASTTERLHGYADNAEVGDAISHDKINAVMVSSKTKFLEFGLSMDFARLYETWNFAFITGNLEFANIVWPKLLIPRVLQATGAAYMSDRVIALWYSIQFYLMQDLQKVEHKVFQGQRELSALMGKINLRYYKWVLAKQAAHEIKVKKAAITEKRKQAQETQKVQAKQ
jgi:hypothetical protein